jgi:hypothetical protein
MQISIAACRHHGAYLTAFAAIVLTFLPTTPADAIVAGRDAGAISRHVVRLAGPGIYVCSGTVIGRQEVLTSAHCIDSAGPYYVLAGGKRIAIASQSDNGGTVTLRLAQPLPGSAVPIETGIGSGDFIIAGYGLSREIPRGGAGVLREAKLVLSGAALVDPNRRGEIGASACLGDSGGPVARLDGSRYVLVGIIERASHPSPTRACGHLTHYTAVSGSLLSSSLTGATQRAATAPMSRPAQATAKKSKP